MSSTGLKRFLGGLFAVLAMSAAVFAVGCGGNGGNDTDSGEPTTTQSAPDTQPTPPGAEPPAGVNAAYVPSFDEVKQDKGPVFSDGCLIHGDEAESGPCEYGDTTSSKKVVVFGDSHALQWTPALIEVSKERGWKLIALLHANCTAAQVNVDPNCDRWRDNALKRIGEERPGLVVVASNTGPNMAIEVDGEKLGREEAEPFLESGMEKTFRDLMADGAAVTLMQDMAMSKDYLPSECVAEHPDAPERCTFEMDRPPALAYDLKAADAVGGIQVIDPLQRICPGYTCDPVDGRYLKFRDRFHISATYSTSLAPWLDSELQNPW